jgi:hypothetical protein
VCTEWTQLVCRGYLCTDCGALSTGPLLGAVGAYLPSVKSDVNNGIGIFCFATHPTWNILLDAVARSCDWLPSFVVVGTFHLSCLVFCKRQQTRKENWRKSHPSLSNSWRIFSSFQLGQAVLWRSPHRHPAPHCHTSMQTAELDFPIRVTHAGKPPGGWPLAGKSYIQMGT